MRTLPLLGAVLAQAVYGQVHIIVSDAEVQRVHRAAGLIDSHNDVPYYTVQGRDIASASASPQTTLTGLKAGSVEGLFFSIWVAKDYVEGNRSANRALQLIHSVRHDVVEKHPADFMLA